MDHSVFRVAQGGERIESAPYNFDRPTARRKHPPREAEAQQKLGRRDNPVYRPIAEKARYDRATAKMTPAAQFHPPEKHGVEPTSLKQVVRGRHSVQMGRSSEFVAIHNRLRHKIDPLMLQN